MQKNLENKNKAPTFASQLTETVIETVETKVR